MSKKLNGVEGFWDEYVVPAMKEMASGKRWYDFSYGSLRTFEEFGILKKEEKILILEYLDCKIIMDPIGRCKEVIYENTSYHAPEDIEAEIFVYSLPAKKSFHD